MKKKKWRGKWQYRCFKPRDGNLIGMTYYKSISLFHLSFGFYWFKINIFQHR